MRHPIFDNLGRMSQRELARRTGFSPQYVGQVRCGYDKPSHRFMTACSRALGKPVDELFRAHRETVWVLDDEAA